MLLFLLSTVGWAAPEMIPVEVFEAARSARPDDGASAMEIPLRDGGTFRLAEHRGAPVVLTFWASWCGPCRAELPMLSAWAKARPGVSVVAVNVDRAREPAERFMASVRFDLPVAFDPDAEHLGRYGVESMPTMFLYDRKGELAWRNTGFSRETGFGDLDAAIGRLR